MGLKEQGPQINFAGLPKAAPDSRSDTVAGESRRPKTAPGLLMSEAAERRSEILMENGTLRHKWPSWREAGSRAPNHSTG